MTYRALGQASYQPTVGSATLGPDRSRQPDPSDPRMWITSGRWAQRAVNAWRASHPGTGPLIFVDGRVGPITLAAMNSILPGLPPPRNYPSGSVTDQVTIARTLADTLAALAPVPDPPRPARAASSSAHTGSSVPEAVKGTSADPSPVVYDAGGGRPSWLMPVLVVGGVTLVGVGGMLVYRGARGVRANRRRTRR